MAEFLINERSRALLDLVDAFKLSESELRDVWDGIFNRISEIAEIVRAEEKGEFPSEKPLTSEVIDEMLEDYPNYPNSAFKPIGFDDPMIYVCDMCKGSGYIDEICEDGLVEVECGKCNGSGVLSEDDDVEELVDSDKFEELMEDYIAEAEKKGDIPF